ncbi:hypothetical protein CYY_003948 [Polysphondylium violaceum]|uniref:Sodium/calcium exchanger membrane region domain-containing protein n=1 Tax=Polysphondylium violaceum TaxID=133409 RepID=A0A8J4UZR3_9MYCE|nr:hypothetical protein CYY_003948 [Polysphondylium violaceum]
MKGIQLIVLFAFIGCLLASVAFASDSQDFAIVIIDDESNACSECTSGNNLSHFYCPDNKYCISNVTGGSNNWPTCASGWCTASTCQCQANQDIQDDIDCLNSFWPCTNNIGGMLFLMAGYGVILGFGAKFISEGSEMLMEILDPGLIGGLLLPFLSAFPDACIIVVAGALSDNPQAQLAIGIGTLAGSTIMLLTIPWSISLCLARTDIRNGESVDNQRTVRGLLKTGTTVDRDTQINAKIMVYTSVSYLIVQGVAFAYLHHPDSGKAVEKWFALVGFIVCFALMIIYSVYQVVQPKLQEKKMAEAKRQYLLKRTIHHFIHNLTKRKAFSPASPAAAANENSETDAPSETSPLISSEHARPPVDVKGIGLKWKSKALNKENINAQVDEEAAGASSNKEEDEDFGPRKRRRIAIRAVGYLVVGAFMVTIFSDPMVDVITRFGTKINVNLFFVSFILTPFCSNASELISSLIFASKRKKENSSLTFSALYGSATMNNTMCLGIFFALVFFKGLTWEYSAETVAILFVTCCVGIIGAARKTIKTIYAPIVFFLYPISLLLVYLLEHYAHWQ